MITPTYTKPHHVDGSPHRFYEFENGNTASLVRFIGNGCSDHARNHGMVGVSKHCMGLSSWGAEEGLYEMATITPTGKIIDVVGYLDEDAVMKELERRQHAW